MTTLRHRLVPASDPDADPACRLTAVEGRRRQADTDRLFDQLVEQRLTPEGQEFIFRGKPQALWRDVSLFVDEEARCCPFFAFEQIERPDGVLLRVSGKTIGREE